MNPTDTPTALITGANRGLGHETARRLARLGWTIWLGSRDLNAGQRAAAEIAEAYRDAVVRPVQLDVTDDDSVQAAAKAVGEDGGLDVLVNNAGTGGRFVGPLETTAADFVEVYGVNVLGPVRVTNAFEPMLRASDKPRLVMVSSAVGSFGVTQDPRRRESTMPPGLVYPSSKSALNMITTMYARVLPQVRVTAVCPGWTATDLNGSRADPQPGQQTVQEGAEAIVRACVDDEVSGLFFNRAGVIPW